MFFSEFFCPRHNVFQPGGQIFFGLHPLTYHKPPLFNGFCQLVMKWLKLITKCSFRNNLTSLCHMASYAYNGTMYEKTEASPAPPAPPLATGLQYRVVWIGRSKVGGANLDSSSGSHHFSNALLVCDTKSPPPPPLWYIYTYTHTAESIKPLLFY